MGCCGNSVRLHLIHARSKRGLLNVIGKASKFLFGTATEDDIRDLREHFNRVLSFAAKNSRAINLNYRKIAKQDSHLSKLLVHTNKLASFVNRALQRQDQLTGFLLRPEFIRHRCHSHLSLSC